MPPITVIRDSLTGMELLIDPGNTEQPIIVNTESDTMEIVEIYDGVDKVRPKFVGKSFDYKTFAAKIKLEPIDVKCSCLSCAHKQ